MKLYQFSSWQSEGVPLGVVTLTVSTVIWSCGGLCFGIGSTEGDVFYSVYWAPRSIKGLEQVKTIGLVWQYIRQRTKMGGARGGGYVEKWAERNRREVVNARERAERALRRLTQIKPHPPGLFETLSKRRLFNRVEELRGYWTAMLKTEIFVSLVNHSGVNPTYSFNSLFFLETKSIRFLRFKIPPHLKRLFFKSSIKRGRPKSVTIFLLHFFIH